ncbi:ROK family protein [Aeromonas jandaei]
MDGKYVIGIDWGGTRIKWGGVDDSGKFLYKNCLDYNSQDEIEININRLIEQINAYINSTGNKPYGFGLSLTSIVDPKFGVVYLPGKVKGLAGYPIVDRFHSTFQCPVVADNDGRAALLAEYHYGLARDVNWAVVLTIGTGIGSGVLIDGKVLRNPNFQFGCQFGHLMMFGWSDEACLTGYRGTGEMNCSATALVNCVRNSLERGIPSRLSDKYHKNPNLITFKSIINDGVRVGDELCIQAFEAWRDKLSFLIVNAIHAYGPQRVILSGGATLAADLFLDYVQKKVDSLVFIYPQKTSIPIFISNMQEHSGVLGATCLINKAY